MKRSEARGGLKNRPNTRATRLIGDREARRAAQELIRADAAARWAKLGITAYRLTLAGLLLTVLGDILAIAHAYLGPAQRPTWLAGLFTVLGVLSAVLVWVLKAAPLGWVIAAVWEGRDRSPGAGFLLHPHRDDPDPWIERITASPA